MKLLEDHAVLEEPPSLNVSAERLGVSTAFAPIIYRNAVATPTVVRSLIKIARDHFGIQGTLDSALSSSQSSGYHDH